MKAAGDLKEGLSIAQEMEYAQRVDEEFNQLIKLYKSDDMLGDLHSEDFEQYVFELLDLYNNNNQGWFFTAL